MSDEPFTVFVSDDVAPADVEHWLSFDGAVLPDLPLSTYPHSQAQPLPDAPFIPLDPSLAFLIGDVPTGDVPIVDDAAIRDSLLGDANTDYRPSPSLGGGDIGVGGLRGPSADPPSAPPPCKLPRRPPDLSSRLAAVLQNINPPRPALPRLPLPRLPKPGLPSPAAPAAPVASAPVAAPRPFAPPPGSSAAAATIPPPPTTAATAAAVAAGGASSSSSAAAAAASAVSGTKALGGFTGLTCALPLMPTPPLASAAPPTSSAAAFGLDQGARWPPHLLQQAHVAGVGPERPLHVDGLLLGPMSGAREGMLKQQLMAMAEAMAVDDSVRWRQFMRQLRREAAAGGDTLQRIAFHALEALEARMDGTALVRMHTPMNVTVEVLPCPSLPPHHYPHPPNRQPCPFHPTPNRAPFQPNLTPAPLPSPFPSPCPSPCRHPSSSSPPSLSMSAPTWTSLLRTQWQRWAMAESMDHAPHSAATHPHAPHAPVPPAQPAPPPVATSPFTGQSAQRRRLHIIAVGFYGGPHWINILMRLAAHFSTPPLLPTTANDLPPSGVPAGEAGAAPGAAGDNAIGAQGEAGAFGAGLSEGGATAAGASGGGSSRFTTAAPFPTFASPLVKVSAIDFGVVKVEEFPTGLVHLGKEYLEQVASMLDLPLTFHGIETTPQDFHPSLVEVEPGEEIVVLASWGLMVFPDDTVLRSNPRNSILKWIRGLRPLLLLQVENDIDANGPFFLSRFHASFMNFAAFVESFDCSMPHAATPRFVAETILARDFLNGVACEGMNRYVRSEQLGMWVHRMRVVGLDLVPIGPDTVAAGREATEGRDKRFWLEVHAETGALQLSWRGVPLIFIAAWK
ncbi:unnamed protein product [Closterium sp. NIES-64]|nr:unnamed protein product [Closterium sp. NIES-64]